MASYSEEVNTSR